MHISETACGLLRFGNARKPHLYRSKREFYDYFYNVFENIDNLRHKYTFLKVKYIIYQLYYKPFYKLFLSLFSDKEISIEGYFSIHQRGRGKSNNSMKCFVILQLVSVKLSNDEVHEAIYIPIEPDDGGLAPLLPLKFRPVPSAFKELDNVR